MRNLLLAAAMLAVSAPLTAYAADPAPKFSTATSSIKVLMADAQAKAVIEKHMPQIAQAPMDMVGDQTLKALQGMAQGMIPDTLLATIDADLAKIK